MAAQFDLAELERLYAAHEALSIVKDTETRYKARNKLRIFLHKHVPAILAMGTECERLRGERDARIAELEAQVKACHMERDNLKGNLTALEAYREKVRIEFANQLLDLASREGV